jgi:ketosteroid isomerase-like protein
LDPNEIVVVRAFITAINKHDSPEIVSLMAEDYTFVDSDGRVGGRGGWDDYFRMFPDYKMEVESMFQDGNMVAVFGSASGTYNGKRGLVPENRITMPAAWKSIVENGKIKQWQVYADWTEGRMVIEKDKESTG